MRILGLVIATAIAAASMSCASGNRAACDPATETCDGVDAAVDGTTADAPIDGPKAGFGEACTDAMQCESEICLLVGIGGQCSKLCGSCPTGYGCLGVTGVVIEGQVSFVCVPTSNQLCSPCTADTECALVGMDKCVTYDDGDRYCSRDCTTVACPTGYGCEDTIIGGLTYKQCIANSAACDCDATNPGAMQPCNIPTPWNVCAGTQTCAGATGWGTCAPPSATDDPDPAFVDSNCDGIDGEATRGIFVAVAGTDTTTCGLVYTNPCATISYGIRRAALSARSHVFVQTGTYNEVVVLASAIAVWGGYDVNWQRGPYSTASHRVRVVGKIDDGVGGDNAYLTVRAHNIAIPGRIDNMILEGPAAVGAGNSSYVVHVAGSDVGLTNVQIVAADGANGSPGTPGLDANPVTAGAAATGGTGGDGQEQISCDGSSHGGGGLGRDNFCISTPSSRPMDSGPGGNGGEMDTSCPFSLNATSGDAGTNASYVNGGFGTAGAGGPANSGGSACNSGGGTPGGTGNPGFVQNGPAGTAGASGAVTAGYWTGTSGTSGSTGENGGGGGAGGGGGGCDDGTDAYGAGGGGGGAGGCAALSGGTGGSGGGGSFGVFVVSNSSVAIMGCAVVRGRGGDGGGGGAGGSGQFGGGGGSGGGHQGASAAGNGGAGGHGGHGGGGGGGAGGRSIGVVSTPGSSVTDDCTFSAGTGGAGGAGGNTPGDGNDGPTGSAGTVEGRRVCASGTSC